MKSQTAALIAILTLLLSSSSYAVNYYRCPQGDGFFFSIEPCDGGEVVFQENHQPKSQPRSDTIRSNFKPIRPRDPAKLSDSGWYYDARGFHRGKKRAIDMEAPMLVYFYGKDCQRCRQFERSALREPAAKDELLRFIKVKVNISKDLDNRSLYNSLGGRGVPFVIVLNKDNYRMQKLRTFHGKEPVTGLKLAAQLRKF